jgi:hypothetical protein
VNDPRASAARAQAVAENVVPLKSFNLNHCLALQPTQRSLGGVLGITRRILARATYKFVAHPPGTAGVSPALIPLL